MRRTRHHRIDEVVAIRVRTGEHHRPGRVLGSQQRLIRLLDNRVFRLLMMPTRAYLRVASMAVQTFLRTVARVVGSEAIELSAKKYCSVGAMLVVPKIRLNLRTTDIAPTTSRPGGEPEPQPVP